ncbi:MAG: cupin domain-containing protein [Deltaproteobacteria bacterium]|nr:cupin domain-containing protein [Deltaproteobacteria bacterium]
MGGNAVHIDLEGTGDLAGAYVAEIDAKKELKPQRHIYEEMIYVLSGRGATSVWYEGMPKLTFEWEPGSLFAIPLNAWHQHFNVEGNAPLRFLSVTTAPIVLSLYRNLDFIFDNDSVFPERYDGKSDYFTRSENPLNQVLDTNLIANVNNLKLLDEQETKASRGKGTTFTTIDMANGILGAHVLQISPGIYSKLHRHGPGAHVVWLAGEGYTITFPDGGEKRKVDWTPGTMLVPPTWWWHIHCVTSKEPGKHLALKLNSWRRPLTHMHDGTVTSVKDGGNQYDMEDLDPELADYIHSTFVRECEKRGTPVRMSHPLNGGR